MAIVDNKDGTFSSNLNPKMKFKSREEAEETEKQAAQIADKFIFDGKLLGSGARRSGITVKVLRRALKLRGLKTTGTKATLTRRAKKARLLGGRP